MKLNYVPFVCVQHSWWQSWCTASTLQGSARRLLYHGMWFFPLIIASVSLESTFCLFIFSLTKNVACRLWICWAQAYGMYGTITLTRKSFKNGSLMADACFLSYVLLCLAFSVPELKFF